MTTTRRLRLISALSLAGLVLALAGCGNKPSPPPPGSTRPKTPYPVPETLTSTAETAGTKVQKPEPAPESVAPVQKKEPARRKSLPPPPRQANLPPDVLKAFPEAWTVQDTSKPFPHRIVFDSCAGILGYVIDSDSARTTQDGYSGPVPLRLCLDSKGRLRRIYIMENRETPAYLDIALSTGLLGKLLRYEPARNDSIDAVTLATSTSKAIIRGVKATADRACREIVSR